MWFPSGKVYRFSFQALRMKKLLVWKRKTKPQKRLAEVECRIQDTHVALLAAKLHVASLDAQLKVLQQAQTAIMKEVADHVADN